MALGRVLVAVHQNKWILKMVGDVRMTLCNTIDYCLQSMYDKAQFDEVIVDLTETEGIDSTSLGLLAKLSIKTRQRIGKVPTIVSTNADITRTLESMGFNEQIFRIISEKSNQPDELLEVPSQELCEEHARKKVLEAHRILMELSDANKGKFKDLVTELEKVSSL